MDTSSKANIPIFIISGGKGLAGHTMVQSLIIQYQSKRLKVKVIPEVQSEKKIIEVVQKVKAAGGFIAHTMVNSVLRKLLLDECLKQEVRQVDLMGGLANLLENDFGLQSVETPGLYRRINAQYFKRIEAMEFTLNRDDGVHPQKLSEAEIVLTGVSRSGKTPLSVYMSMFGWKVANIPLVLGIDPPKELFEIDKNRVFGLNININHLLLQRQKRIASLGASNEINYLDKKQVSREIQYANMIFERGGFTKMNVTNKAIESTANEIIGLISDRFE